MRSYTISFILFCFCLLSTPSLLSAQSVLWHVPLPGQNPRIQVDVYGNVYGSNNDSHELLKIDRDGKYLWTVSTLPGWDGYRYNGKGIYHLAYTDTLGRNAATVEYFDTASGARLWTYSPAEQTSTVAGKDFASVDGNGNFITAYESEAGRAKTVIKVSPAGELLFSKKVVYVPTKANIQEDLVNFAFDPGGNLWVVRSVMTMRDSKNGAYSYKTKYNLDEFGPDGTLVTTQVIGTGLESSDGRSRQTSDILGFPQIGFFNGSLVLGGAHFSSLSKTTKRTSFLKSNSEWRVYLIGANGAISKFTYGNRKVWNDGHGTTGTLDGNELYTMQCYRDRIILCGGVTAGLSVRPSAVVLAYDPTSNKILWTINDAPLAYAPVYYPVEQKLVVASYPTIRSYSVVSGALLNTTTCGDSVFPRGLNWTGGLGHFGNTMFAVNQGIWKIDISETLTKSTFQELTTDQRSQTPTEFSLHPNYPNPFNPTTSIPFSIAEPGYVSVKIYSLIGQEVATIFEGHLDAGNYVREWRAAEAANGIYFCRLQQGGHVQTRKIVLMK